MRESLADITARLNDVIQRINNSGAQKAIVLSARTLQ
ncbi:hypothetical protein CDHC01_0449 [Corynebacterium diphtheriae HC01]|nr:hypothetical protein CD241_0448 [Corynebacterium diphtheriae 241]AEX73702.1 hypothetical protein CDHC01_0449 [Corynebacterium diphtheriae HC01]AEX78166.1 hypothetical protein CDHC03_0435 [Corynebacterium diphtheriae HC03]AEX80407.1 hypothetical protein CDHC04_0414 [Corynebacterium diphtheriae HC04]